MSAYNDLLNAVLGIVKDDSEKLTPADYGTRIADAISRYSKHRPDVAAVDTTGNGTHDYDLPAGWSDGFSVIRSVEYPIGDVPATLLDEDDYGIYRSPGGERIRLAVISPGATAAFRVTFTIPRTAETVPDIDSHAVCSLAAALCLEDLANIFAQTSDPTIAADVVNYRTKSAEFASRAKRLMALYKEHMGIKADDTTPAASAVADLDVNYPGGADRLTHPRWARERR
jgi:hypothetical protein